METYVCEKHLYEKVEEKGEIKFIPFEDSSVTICGKTIPEIETILNGLELEKLTQIPLIMKNLEDYKTLINNELHKSYETALKNIIKERFHDDKNG